MPGQPYRILSLDGGGSWALIQVRALQELYGKDALGHDVLKRFDLVTANSGGSIVAATLAANWKLSDTMRFFLDASKRKSVFVQLPWWKRITNSTLGIGPRYFATKKYNGLSDLLGVVGKMTLDELPGHVANSTGKRTHFLIVGFDYDRLRASFFRSNTSSKASSMGASPVARLSEAVHASSNAPVNYFDEPAVFASVGFGGRRFWDGGLTGMNNPVLAGVIEALANGVDPASIDALSIGTANVSLPLAKDAGQTPPLYRKRAESGLLNDAKLAAASILDDPPDAATFMAHVALRQPLPTSGGNIPMSGSVVRMNPLVQPLFDPATSIASVPALLSPEPSAGKNLELFSKIAELDMDATEDDQIGLIQTLCEAWIAGRVYNQPLRTNSLHECEIGHRWFADAKQTWLLRAP